MHCFSIGTVTHFSSVLDSILPHSSDFLTIASLWLVSQFPAIISATTHQIASILELWTHLSDHQTSLAHFHTPLIFHQMLASDVHNHSSYYFHIGTVNSLKWPFRRNYVMHHHTPVIFHQMPASDLSVGLLSIPATTHRIASILELWTHLVSQLISILSCSSNFLLSQTKSYT